MSQQVHDIATILRYYSLQATTAAGSGHPTSALSAADLMAVLFFDGFFRADLDDHEYHNNDRLIFSKGHTAPLLYALYAVAGRLGERELMTLRSFESPLEGHPTLEFLYTEVATGSLGQGLAVGVGMAINAQYLDGLPYRTFVLLGDGEMAEGSNWESMQIAAHYKLNQLIGIVDINRLGQCGETMYGHDVDSYRKKVESFGWRAIVIDGHSHTAIANAYEQAIQETERPVMILAKTHKGKGVSFLEDQHGWHGKALSAEQLEQALKELGPVNTHLLGTVAMPERISVTTPKSGEIDELDELHDTDLATRKAYGPALVEIAQKFPQVVVLDAEVSNSTYSELFRKHYPERFFEMYIAEQNMVGVAMGLARRGKIPFCSTFSAFFSRAFDQIRMSQYSSSNIKLVGSHGGVSIGQDGASQMGLEDIALFRTLLGGTVLYPADYVAAEKLVIQMAQTPGICYMRTTRMDTESLYDHDESFTIGGSKVLFSSEDDVVTVIAAGVTVHEAIQAYEALAQEDILVRVIDLYSIKPIDTVTLTQAAAQTQAIITIEDHYVAGGIGEAVRSTLAEQMVPIHTLAVTQMPHSGTPAELLAYEKIDAAAIIHTVHSILEG